MDFPRISHAGFSVLILLGLMAHAATARAQYAVLLPDQPTREREGKNDEKRMDVLLSLVDPFSQRAQDMERPQMLAVVRHIPRAEQKNTAEERKEAPRNVPAFTTQREDLLGDLEEIRYQGKKAWAAHVALNAPGLYQLTTETRPFWNEERGVFEQQFVKTILPVFGAEQGWDAAAGLKFEVLPLTRPFGLMAPALVTGDVRLSGESLADRMVRIARLNTENRPLPTDWHTVQVVKTNASGEFSFICPLPGWWAFMATAPGDVLKGPDGQPKPLEMRAVFWVYVDDPKATGAKPHAHKPAKP